MIVEAERRKMSAICFFLILVCGGFGGFGLVTSQLLILSSALFLFGCFWTFLLVKSLICKNAILRFDDTNIEFLATGTAPVSWENVDKVYLTSGFGPKMCFEMHKSSKPSIFSRYRLPSGGYWIPLFMVKPTADVIINEVQKIMKTRSSEPSAGEKASLPTV